MLAKRAEICYNGYMGGLWKPQKCRKPGEKPGFYFFKNSAKHKQKDD